MRASRPCLLTAGGFWANSEIELAALEIIPAYRSSRWSLDAPRRESWLAANNDPTAPRSSVTVRVQPASYSLEDNSRGASVLRLTRIIPAAAGIITAGLLSGCSGTTVLPTGRTVTPSAVIATATATPAGTASSEPTPITSATGATSSACDGTDLSASGDFGAGAGNDGFLIKLTSISASPCELSGYLSLVDTEAIGPALHVSHGSSMLYSDPGPHSIVVAPGSSAYFGIGYAEAGECADGGTPFHAINIVFASDVLTLPIGTWRMGDIPGFEEICDGDVAETAVSLSKELPPN